MKSRNVFLGIAIVFAGSLGLEAAARMGASSSPTQAPVPFIAESAFAEPRGSISFAVEPVGLSSFLIDAPLEKIKGRSTRFRGMLAVDPSDLRATRGQIDLDLGDLKTETFDDPGKNAKQTEHAHNWMEIGHEVSEKQRAEYRYARFAIKAISAVSTGRVADAPEIAGTKVVQVTADGDLWVHGVLAQKTVKLSVSFESLKGAPTRIRVTTIEPMAISLKQHGIMPRDIAGKLLQGVLERVGKKIDDTVWVTLDLYATAKPG